MTDLRKLIEAVEAGRVITLDAMLVCSCLGWTFPDARVKWILEAEIGSLDAAKALHDALLSGWVFDVTNDSAFVMPPPPWDDYTPQYSGQNDNPARAWLLAILRAYEAQHSRRDV